MYYHSLLHSTLSFIPHVIRTFIDRLWEVTILKRCRDNICPQGELVIGYGFLCTELYRVDA